MPVTAAIGPALRTPSSDSIWTETNVALLAASVNSPKGIRRPNPLLRLPAVPRVPSGPYRVAATTA